MTRRIAESSFAASADTKGAQAWSGEEVMRILEDIRRAVALSRNDARAAASRLVRLLDLPAARPGRTRGGLAPWQKRKIERFIKEHLAESLRVERLADQVSLSASYFHHAFKDTFGISPHAFITNLRLESAQAMLLETQDPLCQVAFACGFTDQSHFCRLFRRSFGEPPGTWRRRHRVETREKARISFTSEFDPPLRATRRDRYLVSGEGDGIPITHLLVAQR